MQIIFGNGQATGKFAMGSSEALGSPSDFAESSIKLDGIRIDDVSKLFGDAPKNVDESAATAAGTSCGAGNKRKRSMLSEEDVSVMLSMTDAVNNVADAIRETKVVEVHPDLYGAVMFMHGFPEESLIVAYGHLLDNKAQGIAFVNMSESHRGLWLRTFLAKQ
jgi:hypothetical protein